jgi:hypothetical protein
VTVTEAGAACTFSVSPTTIALSSNGGTGSVTVSAPGGCAWTATSNASWLVVTSGGSGSGNGTVGYSAAAAPAADRSGTLTIGGQAVTVTQAKSPLSPPTGLRIITGP